MRNFENDKDAFGKKQNGEEIIIIVNANSDSQYININLSPWGITSVSDTLSGEKITDGHNLSMEVQPLSYRIFTPERKQGKCTKIQNI